MYDIEQVIAKTGYTKNSIYTLSIRLGIRPKKGLIQGNPGKGLYNENDLSKFLSYKELILAGVNKNDAYAQVLSCGA